MERTDEGWIEYSSKLREVLVAVKGDGRLVVVGPTLVRQPLRQYLERVRCALKRECEALGGVYVTAKGAGMCKDEIHLNGIGTKVLAGRIRDAIVAKPRATVAGGLDFDKLFDECVEEGRRRAEMEMTNEWGGWRGEGGWR